MQNSIIRKFRLVAMIFGIIAAVLMASLAVARLFMPVTISIMILKVGGLCFIISMVAMMLAMLWSPQLMIRLAVLPVAYSLIMTGYMLYKLQIHTMLMAMLGGAIDPDVVMHPSVSVTKLSMLLHGGVWICAIPLIVAGILKSIKMTKRSRIDFSSYDETKATITNVMDTRTKINRVKAYKISLSIPYYQGEAYEVTKEFLVPAHMLHTISLGKEVTLKINPHKKTEVYIINEYGVL